ncbi:MAG: WxcM-like domain-containing protein [Clostridia bacterium]|nr:WxcM-like domain-containing protein [Clostridia bacterium]MBQ9994010.1 WxcM-like domain-containing protein [Clostridia bacterium]
MIYNTGMQKFKVLGDENGSLIAVEAFKTLPFDIRRVYYIYGVAQGIRRGFHSHIALHQALVCMHGEVKILVKTPYEEEVVTLNRPDEALLIGPMVWREMFDFSPDAVLMVMADAYYTEDDYIRDYGDYLKISESWFAEHPEGIPTQKG